MNIIEADDLSIPYDIKYSARKTLAVQITRDARVVVRAPADAGEAAVKAFAQEHSLWIISNYRKVTERISRRRSFTKQEVQNYRAKAREMLYAKADLWAEKMGVTYGRITIREQATCWGSCSSKGNLNFNWKLVLVSEELSDYVVVHELAHRKEMNHSARFWEIVEREIPDYRDCRRRLKEYEMEIN